MWNTNDVYNHDYESDFDDYGDDDDQDYGDYSDQRIQVHHLETLRTAFSLIVPAKYMIKRIMADERHVVAMSRLGDQPGSRQWFMSIFDLSDRQNRCGDKTARRFFLLQRHIALTIESMLLTNVFLFKGWLVVACDDRELVWFDKKGARSETSTKLSNIRAIYSSGSSLLLAVRKHILLLKR